MSVCTAMHVVGVLYTIPVTKRSGNIAIYEPERTAGHCAHKPIRLIHPCPLLNTIFLVAAPTITFILGVVPALISAYLYDIGDYPSSKIWLEVRHWDWSLLFLTMSVMDIYYGIKFTRILKINILIAESIQGTPYTPFGLSNLKSKSPARFLLITHRIFLVGLVSLGTVFALAQTASIVFRDTLAKAGISVYTHFCTVMWTCTLPVATLIFLIMVHVQLLRNKRLRLLSHSSYRKMESKEDSSRDMGPEPGPVNRVTTGNDPTVETVLELEQVTRDLRREDGTEDTARMSTPPTAAAMRATKQHQRPFSSKRISSIENGLWNGYSQYLSPKEVSALQKSSGHEPPPVLDPPRCSWQEPIRTSSSLIPAATSLKPWPQHHHRQDMQRLNLSTSNVYGYQQLARIQESRPPEAPFPLDIASRSQRSRPSHPRVERQIVH